MPNFFNDPPREILFQIFSFFSIKELKIASEVNKRFNNIAKDMAPPVFRNICEKIESDPNYLVNGIENKTLFNLVIDEKGSSRYVPAKSALAIYPSHIHTPLGKVYEIKLAKNGFIGPPNDECDIPVWHIDHSVVILIKKNGAAEFYSQEDAENKKFEKPLSHLSLEQFLGCECLHQTQNINSQNFCQAP